MTSLNHNSTLLIYPDFYHPYVALSDNLPVIQALSVSCENAIRFYKSLAIEKWNYSYATDKWTIKDVLGHVLDTERVMSYRALCFARRDFAELPGFEQNDYAQNANYAQRDYEELIQELNLLRQSNILMFKGFSSEDIEQTGVASNGKFSVKALGYIIAGHEVYHQEMIKNKYL